MPAARCLDLTRLISRLGRGPWTGVDRVELAYLRALLADPVPLYLLVRTWLGSVILEQDGAAAILTRLEGRENWGAADTFGHLQRKAHPTKRRAEADLRRFAIARAPKGRLTRALKRVFRSDVTYLNVGHSNLEEETFAAWKRLDRARIAVLVHDTIPLDFPEFQRDGTATRFEEKMRVVAAHADLMICNSTVTQADVQRWFGAWGPVPDTVVAHLGVDLPAIRELVETPGLVTLGTIEPRKNHGFLLDLWDDIARDLPAAQVPQLTIIGSRGWKNEDVFARLDAKPVHVHEVSGLSDGQLMPMLAAADALVFPSLAEGYGLPAVEALALGTPVICNDLPVFREILGNSAIYANVDDMYLWKQSILQLAGKREADTGRTGAATGFQAASWADHFNLVLKVV